MLEIPSRHWLIAVLIACLAHVALALALARPSAPLPESSLGMTIELGDGGEPAAGSAGGSPGVQPLQPIASPTLSMTPADAPAPVDVSSVATEADIETSDRAQQVNQAPTNVTKARPEPKPELTQQSTASSPPSEPKAEPKRLTAVPKTANTRKQAERTQAPPARIASPVTSLDASREPNQSRNRAGSGSGDGGHSTGTTAGTGGGGEISANNYYGRLATWLARHKRYPAQARRLRQEGTVKVTFTVDNNGRVVSKRIAHSSGHDLLDREAQAMLERASPLPRIPASLRRSSLTITLPVAFNLR